MGEIYDDAGDYWGIEWEDDSWLDCDHMEADVDVLTGELFCHRCGYHRYLSAEDLQREAELQTQCAEAYQLECDANPPTPPPPPDPPRTSTEA